MRLNVWQYGKVIATLFASTVAVAQPAVNSVTGIANDTSLLAPDATLITGKSVDVSDLTPIENVINSDARQQLSDFVKKIKSATGQFVQLTSGGKQGSSQSGNFAFERPGKFAWKVTQPFEQTVVSDGKVVYQYDVDLMQVTERPIQKSFGASPAAVLFGNGKLEQHFNVKTLPAKENMVWLRATPKVADAGMNYIDIAFANNVPAELRILDSFGKTTTIKLRNFSPNVQLPASTFKLDVPSGVDRVKLQ